MIDRTVATYLVVFGAAVRRDGSPSGTLVRRCEAAARCGRGLREAWFLATGGVGRHGPAEALVMRQTLLALGVQADRVLVETQARDTLESVRYCSRMLGQRGDAERVLVSSSDFHNPRCALLFRLAGFAAGTVPVAGDRAHLGWPKWLRYVAKECVATPWDALLLLAMRAAGRV